MTISDMNNIDIDESTAGLFDSNGTDISSLKPKITVFGVGGAGGNAVNNMIRSKLEGVEFVVTNTDAQALINSLATSIVSQLHVAIVVLAI